MSKKTDKILSLLKLFEFTTEESEVYLYLLSKKASSVVEISSGLPYKRTKLYRILDSLLKKNVVSELVTSRGKKYEARNPSQLELLITQKESSLHKMKNAAPGLFSNLEALGGKIDLSSSVKSYSGIEGLKQMSWNSLQAKDVLRVFETKEMSRFLDYGFSESIRKKMVENTVQVHSLVNQKSFEAWTEVTAFYTSFWSCRFIDPKEVKIQMEILIYNDIFALYSYQDNELFGIEIQNETLARTQKNLFDFMWHNSLEMKVGEGGSASL